MVSMTEFEVNEHQRRIRKTPEPSSAGGDDRETGQGGLQEKIQQWCDKQWPRWKTIRARTDKRSTIAAGAQDFTIFGPFPLCICVETKSKTGKLSEDQRIWAFEMERLGWAVHIVRSQEEFEALVKQLQKQ